MATVSKYDAVVVGSGPNGLAAAITLARAGWSVVVIEAKDTPGGGARTAELTLPGYWHDVCSTVHPLGLASPFFRSLPQDRYNLAWVHPTLPLAHALDGGQAAALDISLEDTVDGLGPDGPSYRDLMAPLVDNVHGLLDDILGPLPLPPRHPLILARFGLRALRSTTGLVNAYFKHAPARALFAGMAAHSMLPLERIASAAFGLVLGVLGHAVGWPLARGGSQSIIEAMLAYLRDLGGELVTGQHVTGMSELPPARAVLFDVTPRQLLAIAGDHLPAGYRRRLQNYRYGPGVFKMDWALDEPIPWQAQACRDAGTIHVGGMVEEIARSEHDAFYGKVPEKPFVLVVQPSLFDPSRVPDGKQLAWAYCHVPNGSDVDMSERIEGQIERFAPGFRDVIRARSVRNSSAMQDYDPNYIGGDINGGVQDLTQLYTRPAGLLAPYRTPTPGIYLCSSSTPPGGGVHGMCGYYAARTVLSDLR